VRQIQISKQFISDWDKISIYIQGTFGITHIMTISYELDKLLDLLALLPEMGRRNLKKKNLRTFIFRKSVIVYSFTKKQVSFLRIIDGRTVKV
jgi:plasmid stabilization system protein ParE